MKTDYTELDAAILERLARGPDDFNALSWAVRHISDPLAKIDPRGRATGWRVVDRRLQALRKRGLIEHSGGSWRLVQKEGRVMARPGDNQLLEEAWDLLRIAQDALRKMGLEGCGSDISLPYEVRMFALNFSPERRDGPGALQVTGNGRLEKLVNTVREGA